jgi:biopolymer transport protein ExbD
MPQQHGRMKSKKEGGGLIITSLIDVFTILVIFLIKNFSTEGQLVNNAENLTLPYSNSTNAIKEEDLSLAITSDMILVDNQPIVPSEDFKLISSDDPDPVILKLKESLDAKHRLEDELIKSGKENTFSGRCVLQTDKNIPFDLVYKVINTATKAGYSQIRLAVQKREG